MDGRLSYIIFYVAFLLIILTITATLPIEIIGGISEDNINALKENVLLPAAPTLTDYFLFPFMAGFSFISKMFLLISVSSAHQFLTMILTPLTIGFIICLYSLLRNG